MKSIKEIGDIRGKRALVRVDWNIPPAEQGNVSTELRIKKSLSTIEYLRNEGARVVLISHADKEEDTLKPVYEGLKDILKLKFAPDVLGPKTDELVRKLDDGEVLLIENLRKNPGEKQNEERFAAELAKYGHVFVNEAFAASHREHASIVGVTKFLPSYAGICFIEEVEVLSRAFYPKRPFLFILGGAKFDTKLPLIDKFLHIADNIFVGGALAHNFFIEQGLEIGTSLYQEGDFNLKEKLDTGKIHLPEDVLIKNADKAHIVMPNEVTKGDKIVDAGPNTLLRLKEMIGKSASILWNGPLGYYEDGFKKSTIELASAMAECEAETILGGADTWAAIEELGLLDKFSFVSTGGGAMLEFLAKGTLPGIEALKQNSS
jgi:phosphoglycerate kinase